MSTDGVKWETALAADLVPKCNAIFCTSFFIPR